jgi:hypothetical protein
VQVVVSGVSALFLLSHISGKELALRHCYRLLSISEFCTACHVSADYTPYIAVEEVADTAGILNTR